MSPDPPKAEPAQPRPEPQKVQEPARSVEPKVNVDAAPAGGKVEQKSIRGRERGDTAGPRRSWRVETKEPGAGKVKEERKDAPRPVPQLEKKEPEKVQKLEKQDAPQVRQSGAGEARSERSAPERRRRD